MSALGQKRTFRDVRLMSALPPKADMGQQGRGLALTPAADSLQKFANLRNFCCVPMAAFGPTKLANCLT